MKNNDVLIQKIVFDLDIDSSDNYQLFFEIISAFVKNNFSRVLEEIADYNSQSNENYFLDKVEIDLDEIDIENLSFIEPLLKEKIQQQINKFSKSRESISKFQSSKFNLEQLLQFISYYGFLPWSFNTKEKVNNFFRASIKNDPNKKSLFNILLKDEKSFLRISNTLSPKNNDLFFKVLLKTEYKFYQEIIELNNNILSENKSLSTQLKPDQVIFHILNLFNKHSFKKDMIIEKSIDFFKSKYSIPSAELSKIKVFQALDLKEEKKPPEKIEISSLIKIFVEIEKKQLLKKLFTQVDQKGKLIDRGFYSITKVAFTKALDQIIKVYEATHKHTTKEIVLNLISFLVKKPRLLKTELLTVSLLGEELIQNKSYKGILSERVFADLVRLLEKRKDPISNATLDKIALLLPLHKKKEHLNFIRLAFFKYFQKNLSKPNLSDLFVEKLNSLVKKDASALPSAELSKIKVFQALDLKEEKKPPEKIEISSLIKIFVEIEKKQLLKKLFTQVDQKGKLIDRGFYSVTKVAFTKALDQIIKVYEVTQKHTTKEIVLNLISFLVKKPRLLKTELLTVSLLGEELIQNKSYKGILSERVFADLFRLLEKRKHPISNATIDKIALLLPPHKKKEHLNFIRLAFFKYFQKNLSKPNLSDLFVEILNSLVKKDASVLPFNSSFLKSKSLTRLQTYLDQQPELKGVPNKKSKIDTINQVDDQYFDFILNLNNEVFNDKPIHKQKGSKEYISLDEILKSPTTLFDFLKTYALQNELINLFSEITLRAEINTKFSKLLKKKFEQWINLEKALIGIQKKIYFSELTTNKFRSVLRFFLIKSLSELNSSDQLIEGEFTFNFLTFLQMESNIEYSKIKAFSEFEYPQDISEGFKVMVDVNQYTQTPEKARSWFYFRDLYYFYLKTNEIPEWSNVEKIDTIEIINFINLLIKRNEKAVLNKIFKDEAVLKNLYSLIVNEPKEFLYQLIQTLENKDQPLKLSLILEKIIDQLPIKSLAFPALAEQLFSRKLWNIQSEVFLHEQLVNVLINANPNFKSNLKSKFIDVIDQVFKESKLKKEFKSSRKKINKTEFKELLQYFIDNNSLPSKYQDNRIEIQTQLIEYLSINPDVSINYIKTIIVDLNYESKLIDVFSTKLLQKTLYVYLTLNKELIQYLDLFFEKIKNQKTTFELTKRLFIAFLTQKKNYKFLLAELFQITKVTLTEGFKTGDSKFDKIFQKESQLIPQELSKKHPEFILQSDLLAKELIYEHSVLNQKHIFNALKYYVEFGSSSYEKISYDKAMYLQIFEMQSRLSIKKHLHSWSKQGQKLDRLMELFSKDKEKETLIELIHFELKDLVKELYMLLQELNLITPIKKINKHLTSKQVREILIFWSKRNIKIDNPYLLISDLIKNFLDVNRIDSDQFLIQLSKVKWTTKKILSQKELSQVFRKPLPKIKKNVEIATTNKLEDQLKEGISISNAGLVISWPFLTTLFTKLGLTENNQFKDDLSIQKGIIATQYLVEGINEFDESKLVLNKILCGVDINFYVDNSIELIDVETAVCDMALKAIIQQWDKIKSVESLRDYFLKREGVLKLTESGYQLYIKAQTTDALLRFLPWNLSIIKSSIMQTKLTIDWKYI